MRAILAPVVAALTVLAAPASAQVQPQVGVDQQGNRWFLSHQGTLVVISAAGAVTRDGTFLAACPADGELTRVFGAVTLSCDGEDISLIDGSTGTTVIYALDASDMSIVTNGYVVAREIGELAPSAAPGGAQPTGTQAESSATAEASGTAGECRVPLGTYSYLYADASQAYYYRDAYTVRIDADGSGIITEGDFEVEAFGGIYKRQGDTFVYINEIGTYTRTGDSEILYQPSPAFADMVRLAPVGLSQSDEFGTYTKLGADRVVFTPHDRRADLVLTNENCAMLSAAEFDYETVIADLGVERIGDEVVVNLDSDVLFAFDSADISPAAARSLDQLAYLIKRDAKGIVLIAGHTDSKGSDAYNQTLSEARAASVKTWLISRGGVQPGQLETVGYGEARPKAHNANPDGSDSPEGRAQNRRVEIRFGG